VETDIRRGGFIDPTRWPDIAQGVLHAVRHAAQSVFLTAETAPRCR
jgi:hypothetical protein